LRVDVASPLSVTSFEWMLDGEKLDLALYVAGVMDRNDANTPPTQDAFDRVMHTNVMGAMMVIPQVAPMVEAANGVFACVSSVMGSLQGTRSSDAALYRISKAALNMVVRTSQPEYPRARMVAMHPGWVQTEMGGSNATLTVEQAVTRMRQTLAHIKPEHAGQFLSYDGSTIAW
jgi:NAD(P)-dependent dehydrogenase (short-subunit alcohol dehydrogenase family)